MPSRYRAVLYYVKIDYMKIFESCFRKLGITSKQALEDSVSYATPEPARDAARKILGDL